MMTDDNKQPLRILVLTTSYPLRMGSVSGIFVERLVNALKIHHEVAVLTPADDEVDVEAGVCAFRYAPKMLRKLAHGAGGIPVALKQTPTLWLIFPLFLLSYFFSALLCARKADIIFANWALSGMLGAVVSLITRKPLVTTLRGADVSADPGLLARIQLNVTLKYSRQVVAVSEDMVSLLKQRFPDYCDKLQMIPNGVDDTFLSANESVLANPDELHQAIFVGSLIERKNIDCTLRALSLMTNNNMRLTIVGEGPQKLSLRKLSSKLGVESRIQWLGQQSSEQVANLLKNHPVFISASQHEGRPNSVLEAMASGCICFLSDIRGHTELGFNRGAVVLFPANDPVSLAQLLDRTLSAPDRVIELGQLARQCVLSAGLTWDAAAKRYDSAFRKAQIA